MRVLVTAASKHGATAEIAGAIGDTLRPHGLEVTVSPAEEVKGVADYDAVVIGSAVYAGHWLKPAIDVVEANGPVLATRPVWLFSSGPIGDPPKPEEDPVDVAQLLAITNARDHRVFAGKLDKSKLGFAERAIVIAFRAPFGDFRDWDEIGRWSETIAESLMQTTH